MAGLNELVTDQSTTQTTLPSWYSQAQQQTVGKAITAESPQIGQTAAQSAINAFGAGSPFAAGQDILKTIGEGAANPWLVSTDATGAQTVTPNVNTALGGLYKSQQDYLKEILPEIDAATTGQAITGGGFGSRMNLSGIANARANAFADLAQKQMQSALQAQQTGVSAGAGLGNVGNQLVQSALNTGTYQQNAPYATPLNLANVLSKIQAPTTVTKSDQLGGLNQIMGLLSLTDKGFGSLLGGTPLRDASGKIIMGADGKPITTPGILTQGGNLLERLFKSSGQATGTPIDTGGWQPAGDTGYWYDPDTGYVSDSTGTVYYNGEILYSPAWEESYYDGGGSGLDLSGGDTSWLDEYDWESLASGENPFDGEWNW